MYDQEMSNKLGNDVIVQPEVVVPRRLGLSSGIAFVVGTIIGSGIFISPKGVLLGTGSVGLCLVAWGLSAGDGGTWTSPAQLVKSLTVAEYISRAALDECQRTQGWTKLTAAVVIISVAIVNVLSVRLAARTQVLFSVIKVGGLLVIIGGGICSLVKGNYGILESGFEGSNAELSGIASALYSGLWAFGGWGNLNYAMEELKKPQRNLPLSIGVSMLTVFFIYMLVNVTYFTLLTKDEFLSSWAVGVTWAEKLFGGGAIFVPIIVACSVFGSANGGAFVNSRMIFAAARDRNFPSLLCYLNVHSLIPTPSVILMTVLALIYLVLPGNVGSILNLTGFIVWGTYGLIMVAHIVFKFQKDTKDTPRVVRVPIFVSLVVLVTCVYLVVAPFLDGVKMEIFVQFPSAVPRDISSLRYTPMTIHAPSETYNELSVCYCLHGVKGVNSTFRKSNQKRPRWLNIVLVRPRTRTLIKTQKFCEIQNNMDCVH
nr:b(0,+)-type amino acid transporter 1 [Crassostrea gigas]